MTSVVIDIDTLNKDLKTVPELNGNPAVLPRFIKICDELVSKYSKTDDDEGLKLSLLNGILNQISGESVRWVQWDSLEPDWDKIKNDLIKNFAGFRDEATLCAYIVLQTQGNHSPKKFYDICNHSFNTIMTYVTLHEKHEIVIESKRDLYKKITMDAFLRGLKDPLGTNVRCMRPDTIETAFKFVNEEIAARELYQRGNIVNSWPLGYTFNSSTSAKPFPIFGAPQSASAVFGGPPTNQASSSSLTFGCPPASGGQFGSKPQSAQTSSNEKSPQFGTQQANMFGTPSTINHGNQTSGRKLTRHEDETSNIDKILKSDEKPESPKALPFSGFGPGPTSDKKFIFFTPKPSP